MPAESHRPIDIVPTNPQLPIGVFDSGIGGLSVLKALMQELPDRSFVYLADIAYAPYGEQDDAYILERSKKIAHWMHDQQQTAGLVIACNTATAAAARPLRSMYEDQWPIVAVEPGLKPAAQFSPSGRIAIMATASTLKSKKLHELIAQTKMQATHGLDIFLCPCEGLAKAIDQQDDTQIQTLVQYYTQEVQKAGSDVVVMGCTHYPLVTDQIRQALPHAQVLDTGQAIAKQASHVFNGAKKATTFDDMPSPPTLSAWSSGDTEVLQNALKRWLPEVQSTVQSVKIE